jgi:hypothetical protein
MANKRVPFGETGRPLHEEYHKNYDFVGDGKSDCPVCHGQGVVVHTDLSKPPVYQNCSCVRAKFIAYNVERAWKGLMQAPRIGGSPLSKYVTRNLWVRASQPVFRMHLRHVAIRHIAKTGPWHLTVSNDAELMTAWLATAVLRGVEIFDPDVQPVSIETLTLLDLVVPPALLVIHLGVKRASNKEMKGVLHEALSLRFHENKPTWIFDQPYAPLEPGHLCFDYQLMDALSVWGYVGPVSLEKTAPQYGVHEVPQDDPSWLAAEISRTPVGNTVAPVRAQTAKVVAEVPTEMLSKRHPEEETTTPLEDNLETRPSREDTSGVIKKREICHNESDKEGRGKWSKGKNSRSRE